MHTDTSLFSRARPGKSTPKKIRGFLALPGEIRNMVYSNYFCSELRCEFAAKGCYFKKSTRPAMKLRLNMIEMKNNISKWNTKAEDEGPVTIRISRTLGNYDTVQGLRTNWHASICALHLVCKAIYAETAAFVYQKTIFVFEAPARINNFCKIVSKPQLANISKLQLHYSTYGAPKLLDDTIWQDKHTESWTRACRVASKKLLCLRNLEVWVHVNHNPLRFNLHQKWVKPVLQFRRLTCSPNSDGHDANLATIARQQKNLEIVKVHIQTCWSKEPLRGFSYNEDLAKASADLHSLFGRAISLAILGAKEQEAMSAFNEAWSVTHRD